MTCSLYLPRWNDVLVEIHNEVHGNRYCQKLIRRVKGSLTHLREVVRLLEKSELVKIVPTKKIKQINLTEKGRRACIHIMNLKSELQYH